MNHGENSFLITTIRQNKSLCDVSKRQSNMYIYNIQAFKIISIRIAYILFQIPEYFFPISNG